MFAGLRVTNLEQVHILEMWVGNNLDGLEILKLSLSLYNALMDDSDCL